MTTGLSRRGFLSAAAGAAAGAAAVGAVASAPTAAAASARSAAAPSEDADIVIVGSGYAGSVAALRLAQAGKSALVLERGRRWTITDRGDTFCTGDSPDGRALWLSTSSPLLQGSVPRSTGVLQAVIGAGVVCLAGAGVGGGSLVNNAVMMQPEESDFRQVFGDRLPYADMAGRWYPRARDLIGASPIPDDVLASPAYANARQTRSELAAAGVESIRPDIAVDWSVVRREIAGSATPSLIEGHCIFGVNSGAKLSVDRTVLADAEATGRVAVRELTAVSAVRKTASGFELSVSELDLAGDPVREYTVTARRLVLAAGSLNTNRLLLRARAEGTIPGLSSSVGTGWGTGGDGIVLFGGLPNPQQAVGGPAHVVGRYRSSTGLPVSLLNFPLGVAAVDSLVKESLAVGHVPGVGVLRRTSNGDVLPVWNQLHPEVLRARGAMTELVTRIDDAVPDRSAVLASQMMTSHPLGGVVLKDLTDDAGEVIGVDGLFVIDSSLVPGSTGGVPPALTVTALADRCVTTGIEAGAFGA